MKYTEMENILSRYFHSYQQSQILQGRYSNELELSMNASPAYWLSDDKKLGGMSCDTYTYRVYQDKETQENKCELLIKKAEAAFVENEWGITMEKLNWYTIQTMNPWIYTGENPFESLKVKYPGIPLKQKTDEIEYIKIRNLQNSFFERRMHSAKELFSDREDSLLFVELLSEASIKGKRNIIEYMDKWLEKEKENKGYYIFLGITGIPVIEIEADKKSGKGLFIAELFQVKLNEKGEQQLIRCLAWVESEYIKDTKDWKIHRMKIENILSLPSEVYRNDIRYDKMGRSNEVWNCDIERGATPLPEVAMEVENIMNRWVYGCRYGNMSFFNRYIVNPLGESRMLIRSQGEETKALNDLVEIEKKLEGMTLQFRERHFSYHIATTPVIEINEMGDYAKGTWFDHSATNLRSMAKSKEHIPYMVFLAKYVHEFKKIQDKWYLTNFFWEPVICLPDWELNLTKSQGYISKDIGGRFPEIFEL